MHIRSTVLLSVLLLPLSVLGRTVVYTDSQHPPVNTSRDTQVVWLDGPDRLQTQFFGMLSSDPKQAAAQASTAIQSPEWNQHQQQIATTYRAVVHAWEIGVYKYPAVVFDDADVVYGTADVAQATALRTQGERP